MAEERKQQKFNAAGYRKRADACRAYWVKKRGFAVPAELAYDYYLLTSVKRMKPQDAAKALGLLCLSALFFAALFLGHNAQAHDHWINHHNYIDPVYGWRCCGEDDCHQHPPESIKQDANGDWIVPLSGGGGAEVVEDRRLIPTEDGQVYVCEWGGEFAAGGKTKRKVRCLFGGKPGT